MSDSEPVAALRRLADALDALGVRYFLGGSGASSAHGIARASLDADLIVDLGAQLFASALLGSP